MAELFVLNQNMSFAFSADFQNAKIGNKNPELSVSAEYSISAPLHIFAFVAILEARHSTPPSPSIHFDNSLLSRYCICQRVTMCRGGAVIQNCVNRISEDSGA